MIRLRSITIKEFRGIRDLSLDFHCKNFAVSGPNGTGKSGVVDAIEFVLTGQVSRLSGEGKGDISLRVHGPHVDSRNAPDKARVTATVEIPSLGKSVIIERTVKAPGAASVDTDDAAVLTLLKEIGSHPEFVLSRRELIRYVLATPGKRAEEVQALLQLTGVEQVRTNLQKIANASERQLPGLVTVATQAQQKLREALGLTELTKDKVLAAVNAQRAIIGLPALPDLTKTVSVKDGMATPAPGQPQRIPKRQALLDVSEAHAALREIGASPIVAEMAAAQAELRNLAADAVVATGVARHSFYSAGLGLLENDSCPFCDNNWDLNELKAHIQEKLEHLEEVAQKRSAIVAKLTPIIAALTRVKTAIDVLVHYGSNATPAMSMTGVRDYSASLHKHINALSAVMPLEATIAALTDVSKIPTTVHELIGGLETYITALPEPSAQQESRDFLTLAQERLTAHRDAQGKLATATEQVIRTRTISDTYAEASDAVLTGIYAAVEKDFAELYRAINRDDENAFTAKLVPSMGKLGFDVDFYGRGSFPPGAYHSEGHQDGMGLCLYLALMRHLQGDRFTFAVLDDVLMSVDTGHRREVCALLKKEFPSTQFIMTTHDRIWLRHMKSESLIGNKAAVEFKKWTVDNGPTAWDGRDVWTEIEEHLSRNEIRAAAGVLRNYLEYIAAELCHRLRAPVEFRGDAQYQLGDLLPMAVSKLKDLYRQAKAAANSWGQVKRVTELSEADTQLSKLLAATQADQWQTNAAIHFNSWDNLGKHDFVAVVSAFRGLLGAFACAQCGELLRVAPDREIAEAFRCECGSTSISLVRKP